MQFSFSGRLFKSQSLKYTDKVKHFSIDMLYEQISIKMRAPFTILPLRFHLRSIFSAEVWWSQCGTFLLQSEARWHYQQPAEQGSECNYKVYWKI